MSTYTTIRHLRCVVFLSISTWILVTRNHGYYSGSAHLKRWGNAGVTLGLIDNGPLGKLWYLTASLGIAISSHAQTPVERLACA